jgi:hypothetical protein
LHCIAILDYRPFAWRMHLDFCVGRVKHEHEGDGDTA